MADNDAFRRYLALGAAAAGGAMFACVALVLVVDPYRLYRLVERTGFNQVKTQPKRYQKEIKLAGARALKANLLIVGNSRAEIGLDPDYPALSASGLTPYNLALAGTRIQVAREQLEQLAGAGQHPKHLIAGVDFFDFPVDPAAAQQAAAAPASGALAELGWRFDTLFSIDSVADALKTMRIQNAAYPSSMTARGFNPLREYQKMARDEGYYALFQQRAQDYARRLRHAPSGLVSRASGSSREFDQVRAVIERAIGDGATIDVVIYPYHAQVMSLFEAAGLAPLFDTWKGMLAAQMDGLRAAHPAARITLWDFSGYAQYQCEPIPAMGDRKTETTWYWEAGHFKPALGNLMLARMLGAAGAGAGADASFGTPLTTAGLAANRARIARERAACLAAYPSLFRDTAALMTPQPGR